MPVVVRIHREPLDIGHVVGHPACVDECCDSTGERSRVNCSAIELDRDSLHGSCVYLKTGRDDWRMATMISTDLLDGAGRGS